MSLISTAITGIRASQLALSTTGHNIVNANTEGYSRQSVETGTANPMKVGVGYMGTGVLANEIFRHTDKNLVDQVGKDISTLSDLDTYLGNVTKIDNLFAGESTNLAQAMNRFFDAMSEASDDPSSMLTRQLLLTETNVLMDNFKQVESRLRSQHQAVNSQIDSVASSITTIANELANLNRSIGQASSGGTQMPNDLLDKRDQLVRELSAYVDVETVLREDNTMDISIGQGQPLVVGLTARELVTVPGASDPTRRDLALVSGNRQEPATRVMSGGELGGLLRFREEALNPAFNAIGRLVMGVVDNLNEQHQLGMDLEGNLGKAMFTDINSQALVGARVNENSNNSPQGNRSLSAVITDVSELGTSDYELSFSGPGGRYSVTRLSDGQVVSAGQLGASQVPHTIELDGFELRLESGHFASGDRFLVQPSRNTATGLQALINRPEELALASPVRTAAAAGNQGGAFISPGEVNSVDGSAFNIDGQLSPPVMIRFTSPTTYDVLDYSNPARPVPLDPPLMDQQFTPGTEQNVFPDDPGGTGVSSLGDAARQIQLDSTVNGYGPENLTIETSDLTTGFIKQQTLAVAQDETAASIAARLSALDGVQANAWSELKLRDFSAGTNGPVSLSLNGVDLTDPDHIPDGQTTPQAVPDPLTADFLRDRINNDGTLAAQGIYARSDGETLTVRSSQGVDLSFTLGDSDGSMQLESAAGTLNVTGPAPTDPAVDFTVGGQVDVQLAANTVLTSNEADGLFGSVPEAKSNYLGYQVSIGSGTGQSGQPSAGDRFTIEYNRDGSADSRNAGMMRDLGTAKTLSDGNLSFQGAYGQLVEEVGILTNQTRLSQQASETMLRQSMDAWQSVSGVNVEEEAARLIELEQHYNASARLIGLARDLFDTLLNM